MPQSTPHVRSEVTAQIAPQAVPHVAPFRRLVLAVSVVLAFAAASTVSTASTASAAPLVPPPPRDEDRGSGDHLTVTVRGAGEGVDGTFELYCHPGGGSHPDVSRACRAVERNTRWGRDAFAPVPKDSLCTLRYGGPATAHVTGRWAGRPVDTTFDRADGCRIERWDRFVPLLPAVGTTNGEQPEERETPGSGGLEAWAGMVMPASGAGDPVP